MGVLIGGALTAVGFKIHLTIKVNRTGNVRKSDQRNIRAGGDVVGRDKVSKSDK